MFSLFYVKVHCYPCKFFYTFREWDVHDVDCLQYGTKIYNLGTLVLVVLSFGLSWKIFIVVAKTVVG